MGKRLIIGGVVVIMAFLMCSCGKSNTSSTNKVFTPAYRVSNSSEYAAGTEKGKGYRIVVIPPITDEQLLTIFNEVTSSDNYNYHTVWFYASEDEVIQGAYTVAMLEQKTKGASPQITRSGTVSKNVIKAEVEASIPSDYKGKSYTCDILTPTDEEKGFIASLQLDNDSFTDEATCKKVAVETIRNIYNSNTNKNISTIDITFVSNYKSTFIFSLGNLQNIKSTEEIETHITATTL